MDFVFCEMKLFFLDEIFRERIIGAYFSSTAAAELLYVFFLIQLAFKLNWK